MPMTIASRNGYIYSYKNKLEKIKNETYNTDVVEPYIQEFIKDKLYLTWTNKPITVSAKSSIHYFTIDDKLRYISFFADFGPLNIAQVIKFCDLLNTKFKSEELKNKKIVLVSGPDNDKRANSAFLMCAYLLLVFNLTPDEAFKPIADIANTFEPYRDAGYGPATYFITIKHCLQGLYKALKTGLLDIDSLDIDEYEYYEKVEHGDLNWITKKFIAFASPKERPTTHGMYNFDNQYNTTNILQSDINSATQQWFRNGGKIGNHNKKILYPANTMDGIVKYFKDNGVTCVVRLNNKLYDNRKFLEAGINHFEFYFPDGTIPPDNILFRFFELCETNPGSIAIHCKAGLGRTGTLIGAYLMKTYKFLAAEVIAFLRLMRPGCVVGPQQNYLQSIEQKLLRMKVTPLPYQISCVKAPTSNIIRRFNVNLPFSIDMDKNEAFIKTKNISSDNDYSNEVKKKNMYISSSNSTSSSSSNLSYTQRNNKSYNSSSEFNKNGFSIPVQPRKTMDYQNNNSKNVSNNENSENILLKQIESNELRSIPQETKSNKQKIKSSKSYNYSNGSSSGSSNIEDNIKNLAIVDKNITNYHANSCQQLSKSNNKGSLRDLRNHSNHLKKTKSDNQSFQKFFNSNSVTYNTSNGTSSSSSSSSPTTSSSLKFKKPLYSPNNHSTPILPQARLYNTSNISNVGGNSQNYHNPFIYSKQNSTFSNSTNSISSLSSVSTVVATPNLIKKNSFNSNSAINNISNNGFNYTVHGNGYYTASPSRSSYYNNMEVDMDYPPINNRRKNNYNNRSLHEKVYNNLLKKDNSYTEYNKSPRYEKKYN